METGTRFWQLLGMVGLVLGAYFLAELHDTVTAKETELNGQRQLLTRQEALLKDNRWIERLKAVSQARQDWLKYLPVEDSPALAKAHILTSTRYMAQNAGLSNVKVDSTDSDSNEQVNLASSSTGSIRPRAYGNDKSNALPTGVQMSKVHIAARFEPTALTKLLHALEQEGRFVKLDSVTVRAAQLNINLRTYWRLKDVLPAAGSARSTPVVAKP